MNYSPESHAESHRSAVPINLTANSFHTAWRNGCFQCFQLHLIFESLKEVRKRRQKKQDGLDHKHNNIHNNNNNVNLKKYINALFYLQMKCMQNYYWKEKQIIKQRNHHESKRNTKAVRSALHLFCCGHQRPRVQSNSLESEVRPIRCLHHNLFTL